MKNYHWYYLAACAYILLGLWNFFDWRWQNAVLLEVSHPHLWLPALGAVLLSLSPVLRHSQNKAWLYSALVLNVLAMAVLLRLTVAALSENHWKELFFNFIMLGIGTIAVWVTLKPVAKNK